MHQNSQWVVSIKQKRKRKNWAWMCKYCENPLQFRVGLVRHKAALGKVLSIDQQRQIPQNVIWCLINFVTSSKENDEQFSLI